MFRPSFLFLLPFALFESACAATITSAPPFPTTNATSTSVSPSTCPTGKCAFKLPVGSQLQWFRFSPSTTIVAATVSVFIVNGTNTTSTTTIFNDLPSGIAPPPTNAAGTRTTVVTSFAGGTVEVAYPTGWADYDSLVTWSGTLLTKGICSTETGSVITLAPHSAIPTSLLQEVTTDATDPEGIYYSPTLEPFYNPRLNTDAPNEDALKSCAFSMTAPLIAVSGVRFLTETTTDFGSSPATTTADAVQGSSNTPAPPPASSASPPSAPTSAAPVQQQPPPSSSLLPPPSNPNPSSLAPPPVTVISPAQPSAPQNGNPETPSQAPAQQSIPQSANPGAPAPSHAPVLTFNDNPITAISSSAFVIGTQTLTPGGTITVSGTTIALGPSASFVIVNGITSTLSNALAITTPPPVLTINNTPITASPGGSTFVVSGQTLTPGGTITIDGTTVSLGPSASFVVINGATSTLANPAVQTQAQITPPPLTIGGSTFSAAPGTGISYVIGGQTLTPGGVITVDGTTISLPAGALPTVVVINGETSMIVEATATATASASISSGRGGGQGGPGATTNLGASRTSEGLPLFTGAAVKGARLERWGLGAVLMWGIMLKVLI